VGWRSRRWCGRSTRCWIGWRRSGGGAGGARWGRRRGGAGGSRAGRTTRAGGGARGGGGSPAPAPERARGGARPAGPATHRGGGQALDEVRRSARELRPEMLEHLGLVSALTELSRKFGDQSGIRVERRFADDLPPLSDAADLAVYRVAQESLTNVARHAEATR